MKDLEEIALLGYWCSTHLKGTLIKWEMTCMLLYKEIVSKMGVLVEKNYYSESYKKEKKKMLQNLEGMVSKMEQNGILRKQLKSKLLRSENKNSERFFNLILKESQSMVQGLMKNDAAIHKFCLFKTVRAINLYANLYGLGQEYSGERAKEQDFTF